MDETSLVKTTGALVAGSAGLQALFGDSEIGGMLPTSGAAGLGLLALSKVAKKKKNKRRLMLAGAGGVAGAAAVMVYKMEINLFGDWLGGGLGEAVESVTGGIGEAVEQVAA